MSTTSPTNQPPQRSLRDRVASFHIDPVVLTFIVLGILWAVMLYRVEGYRNVDANLRFVRFGALLAIVAAGQTIVVLMGGIDLSVAAVISLAGVVGGNMITQFGQYPGILITLLLCDAVGMLNGLGVVLLRLPPLVMTLAASALIDGGLRIYNAGNPVSGKSSFLETVALGSTWRIPNPVFAVLIVSVIAILLLHGTSYGRWVYSIGVNPRAALLSGVPVNLAQVITYSLCALCSGIAGLLILGQTSYSFLNMGEPYLLQSIAAVVIGGTSILGGRGKFIGTLGGAMVLIILINLLTVERISQAGRMMVQGGLILVLLIAYAFTEENR